MERLLINSILLCPGKGMWTFEVWEPELFLGDAVGGEFEVLVRILDVLMGCGMEELKVEFYLCFDSRFCSRGGNPHQP